MNRLYIVVRSDLTPGLQIAQSCHAMRAFAARHPELDAAWHAGENNLVALGVAGEVELVELLGDLMRAGYRVAWFCEPDLGDSFTAIAVEGSAKALLRPLKTALASV